MSIEELTEDIARRTLLSSITVRPVLDESGAETAMFSIPTGGRRFRALELLEKQNRMNKTALVPCIVRMDDLAEEDSLAENILRAPLHPLDQFRAIQAIRDKCHTEEEIAAAFRVGQGVSPSVKKTSSSSMQTSMTASTGGTSARSTEARLSTKRSLFGREEDVPMTRFASSSNINRSACTATLVLTICVLTMLEPSLAIAQDRPLGAAEQQLFEGYIADASQSFGIPARWIRAVTEVESAGNPRAVSSAGAIGLTQIIPATWADLRQAHGFGDDPFDSRENILAGTSYLHAMYDRFGSPGFLAAYNAGPARYGEYLATERPLPAETRCYFAILAPIIGAQQGASLADALPLRSQGWREAPLFTAPPAAGTDTGETSIQPDARSVPHGIFVPLSEMETP